MILQTTNPEQNYFHDQANTYDLTVILTNNKLTITLKDFVNWVIYEKEYTEDNIGQEISHKMDLYDVYTAFSQTKSQCEQEKMKEQQSQATKLKQYEFGSVIQKNNIPCYKIEGDGKISTFLTIVDVRRKKQVTYESKLKLSKLRNMTETEIATEKSLKEKNIILQQLIKQIEMQNKQKENLLKRIIDLEEKNLKLKEAVEFTRDQLIGKIQELEYKFNQKNKQIKNFPKNKTNSSKAEVERYQQLQQNLAQTKQQLTEQLAQSKQQGQRLQQKFTQLMNQFELQNQRSLDKFQQIESQLKPTSQNTKTFIKIQNQSQVKPIQSKNLLENLHILPQANTAYFKIDGLKVQYTFSQNVWTQYIFNFPINHKETRKFKLKITHSPQRYVLIGIVDYAKEKDQRSSGNSVNVMCYFSYDGRKFPEQANEGGGFKQDDIVEVEVNRSANTVKYFVNEVHKATQTKPILADSTRIFMPFVLLYYTNDAVEWML